jgi:hypothetical protein
MWISGPVSMATYAKWANTNPMKVLQLYNKLTILYLLIHAGVQWGKGIEM